MDHVIFFLDEWIEVATFGTAHVEGFRAFGEAVATDSRYRPGLKILIDHSRLNVSKLDASHISVLGRRMNQTHPLKDCSHCAFFTPKDMQFGLGRMFEAYRKPPQNDVATGVFNIRKDAEAWLRSRPG